MQMAVEKRRLEILDLGRRGYGPVFDIQEQKVEDRREGRIADTLILVEHDPVYTMGCNADDRNVLLTAEELAAKGIELFRTTRGGDVTYHGPGQLVGYPILDLGKERANVVRYVKNLEDTLIRVLACYGVEGTTDRKNRGVWVENNKIAAIGVRIARSVTMHGFALNVSPNLADYSGIIPCGISGKGITSLDRLVPGVLMDDVKNNVIKCFREVFSYDQ